MVRPTLRGYKNHLVGVSDPQAGVVDERCVQGGIVVVRLQHEVCRPAPLLP